MKTDIELNEDYWSARYQAAQTGWDIGAPGTPLKTYIDGLADKNLHILVPGAGNAYEVEYLWQQGFKNVWVVDIAKDPLENFKQRNPGFPQEQLIHGDFFEHTGQYDLVLEQTFFCALNPDLRKAYAQKMYQLLKPGGVLAGVLFDAPMNTDKPPFGGTMEEYRSYFEPWFTLEVFAPCYNSIAPRAGTEMFMVVRKGDNVLPE